MITRSVQWLSPSKREFLPTHAPRKPVLLRADQPNPGSDSRRSNSTQALRHLRQTYFLERRCFL